MIAVKLQGVIGNDRRLIVDLPGDIPAGPVELVIWSGQTANSDATATTPDANAARDVLRAKLQAAGALSSVHHLHSGINPPNEDELFTAGILPPGVPPSEQLIREDREDD